MGIAIQKCQSGQRRQIEALVQSHVNWVAALVGLEVRRQNPFGAQPTLSACRRGIFDKDLLLLSQKVAGDN
jgi:hypothetical protein